MDILKAVAVGVIGILILWQLSEEKILQWLAKNKWIILEKQIDKS